MKPARDLLPPPGQRCVPLPRRRQRSKWAKRISPKEGALELDPRSSHRASAQGDALPARLRTALLPARRGSPREREKRSGPSAFIGIQIAAAIGPPWWARLSPNAFAIPTVSGSRSIGGKGNKFLPRARSGDARPRWAATHQRRPDGLREPRRLALGGWRLRGRKLPDTLPRRRHRDSPWPPRETDQLYVMDLSGEPHRLGLGAWPASTFPSSGASAGSPWKCGAIARGGRVRFDDLGELPRCRRSRWIARATMVVFSRGTARARSRSRPTGRAVVPRPAPETPRAMPDAEYFDLRFKGPDLREARLAGRKSDLSPEILN